MDLTNCTDLILGTLSAYDVGKMLGLAPNSSGRCACPVHKGHDQNMYLKKHGPWAHCYVCGANLNVIHLVEAVHHCGFKQAVAWLNSTFHLGLNIDAPMNKNASEAAKIAKERRLREQEERYQHELENFEAYLDMDQLLLWAEDVTERYAPTIPGQQWDWRFCAALNQLTELKEDSERCRMACWKVK